MSSTCGFQLLCSLCLGVLTNGDLAHGTLRSPSFLSSEPLEFSSGAICSASLSAFICALCGFSLPAHHGLPQRTLLGTHALPLKSAGAPTAAAAKHSTPERVPPISPRWNSHAPRAQTPVTDLIWLSVHLSLPSAVPPPPCCRAGDFMEIINMTSLIWFCLGPSHALKQIFHLAPDSLFRGSWEYIVTVFSLLWGVGAMSA